MRLSRGLERGDSQRYFYVRILLRSSQLFSSSSNRVFFILIIVDPIKIQREVKILHAVNGIQGVGEMKNYFKEKQSGVYCIAFDYLGQTTLRHMTNQLKPEDIRMIMKSLLSTIKEVHKIGVFHRDLKPSNIMISPTLDPTIIDWGLAEFLIPHKEFNFRVATRPFKAPEILLKQRIYDEKIDIWAIGCIFAGLLFKKDYYFPAMDDLKTLCQIIDALGRKEFDRMLKEREILLSDALLDFFPK